MTGENHLVFVFGLLFVAAGAGIGMGVRASRKQS